VDLAQDTVPICTAGIKVESYFAACAKCADPDKSVMEAVISFCHVPSQVLLNYQSICLRIVRTL
jgi:hypothetical protein